MAAARCWVTEAILASSSSTLTASELQSACARHPESVMWAIHSTNPPHLIPLVEVAGERMTSAEAVERTTFYRAIGKYPIHLRKEIPGYVANEPIGCRDAVLLDLLQVKAGAKDLP